MNHLSSICSGINPRFMRSNSSGAYDSVKAKSARAVGGWRIFQEPLVATWSGAALGMMRSIWLNDADYPPGSRGVRNVTEGLLPGSVHPFCCAFRVLLDSF